MSVGHPNQKFWPKVVMKLDKRKLDSTRKQVNRLKKNLWKKSLKTSSLKKWGILANLAILANLVILVNLCENKITAILQSPPIQKV